MSLKSDRFELGFSLYTNCAVHMNEAPRGGGSVLPSSLKIMQWSPRIPKKNPQLPESILPLLPKSLKLIQLLPKLHRYKPTLPKMYFLSSYAA